MTTTVTSHERFPFGRNWTSFLELLDESRILEAERSLAKMVGADRIKNATFLDVGSGSGLFSLAAMRLGARRVHSFDYDRDSVACTREMRRRFFPDAAQWTVEQGSALDESYLRTLGEWDVVYSWGVLHHTGQMWKALDLVGRLVVSSGTLFIAIYNDQGSRSSFWTSVKRFYNRGPVGKALVLGAFVPYYVVRGAIVDIVRRKSPRQRYRDYHRSRGMSAMVDWKDWLGGYPFEVARPEEIFEFFRERGFSLVRMTTCAGGQGCNEFVFRRDAAPTDR
jgi:2-polyprenyl-6-hydroxyphenyl methylase/3-demethylubiquinone-9 3-methyltransferase